MRQQSINHVLLRIIVTLHGDWLKRSINDLQAGGISKSEIDTLHAQF
jgi:hypothetical protein